MRESSFLCPSILSASELCPESQFTKKLAPQQCCSLWLLVPVIATPPVEVHVELLVQIVELH